MTEYIPYVLIVAMAAYIIVLRRRPLLVLNDFDDKLKKVLEAKRLTDAEFEEKFNRMTEASLTYQLGLAVMQGIIRVKNLEAEYEVRPKVGHHHYLTHFPVPNEGEWELKVARYREKPDAPKTAA